LKHQSAVTFPDLSQTDNTNGVCGGTGMTVGSIAAVTGDANGLLQLLHPFEKPASAGAQYAIAVFKVISHFDRDFI
jgi:hypothetical protein